MRIDGAHPWETVIELLTPKVVAIAGVVCVWAAMLPRFIARIDALFAEAAPKVRLAHLDGGERRIDPSGKLRYRLELYETAPMRLRAGDRVRFTRNDPARGLVNGETAEVLSIGRANVRMRLRDGRMLGFPRTDPQLHHLDHAYSSTVHGAQGRTCERVIGVLDTHQGAVTDQATFYVELTRARDNVVLLTDDREALIEALETARGATWPTSSSATSSPRAGRRCTSTRPGRPSLPCGMKGSGRTGVPAPDGTRAPGR